MTYRSSGSSVSFLVLATIFGVYTGNSFADAVATEPSDAVVLPEAAAPGDTEGERAVTGGECCEDGASEYAGAYIGLGASWQHFNRKVTGSDNVSEIYNNMDILDWENAKLLKSNGGKISGAVSAGWGKVWNKFYAGIDVTCDIAGNSKATQIGYHYNSEGTKFPGDGKPDLEEIQKIKTRAIVPTIAARFGGHLKSIDSLLYLRAGVAFMSNKFTTDSVFKKEKFDLHVKTPTVVPVLGAGFEKKIFKGSKINCCLRGEWDHRFQVKKNSTLKDDKGSELKVASKMWGDSLRMLLVCHVKN